MHSTKARSEKRTKDGQIFETWLVNSLNTETRGWEDFSSDRSCLKRIIYRNKDVPTMELTFSQAMRSWLGVQSLVLGTATQRHNYLPTVSATYISAFFCRVDKLSRMKLCVSV
jgi:hypothetical protein